MKAEFIAPCGMNCRLCYRYIDPRNRCNGCRASGESKPKSCSSCNIILCEKRIQNKWETCALCDMSCRRLKYLDKRYREKYRMSMIENLAAIREYGIRFFLHRQKEQHTCPACGGILCVHRNECPSCKTSVTAHL